MEISIHPSWKEVLKHYLESGDFEATAQKAREAYLNEQVYPHPGNVFGAFNSCPFNKVRVVILGQDPYHNPGQAMGLSFSVPQGVALPPSLQNIYKEIESDLGQPSQCAPDGDLTFWTQQGVLLLNSVLTVRAHEAASHREFGWQGLTDEVIKQISEQKEGVVFLLWGAYAQGKKELIDQSKHLVLLAPHPSPLSAHRGFFGCKHFTQTNIYLRKQGYTPIEW